MNSIQQSINVYYSPWLGVRVIGEILYLLQGGLLYIGLGRRVWIGNQNRILERWLIDVCNSEFTQVYCQTTRVWLVLSYFTIPVVFDAVDELSVGLTRDSYERIMWSMVHATTFSKRSMSILKTIFPHSYMRYPLAD
jgi:hypothetical protein